MVNLQWTSGLQVIVGMEEEILKSVLNIRHHLFGSRPNRRSQTRRNASKQSQAVREAIRRTHTLELYDGIALVSSESVPIDFELSHLGSKRMRIDS